MPHSPRSPFSADRHSQTHAPQQNAILLDHLGAGEQRWGHGEAERLRGLEIDHELELGRLLHWQIARPDAAQNSIHISGGVPVLVA